MSITKQLLSRLKFKRKKRARAVADSHGWAMSHMNYERAHDTVTQNYLRWLEMQEEQDNEHN